MTPYERFTTAAELKQPDQLPAMPYCTGPFISRFAGLSVSDYYLNAKKKLNAQLSVLRRFPGTMFYNGVWADEGVVVEASGFGCEVAWSDTSPPWISRPIVRASIDVDHLQVPDPRHDGLMPLMLEHLSYMRQTVERRLMDDYGYVDGVGYSVGPIDIAAQLRGLTELFKDIYMRPKLLHKLLDITTETVITWLKVQQEIVGGFRWFAVADDYSGLMSPKHFEEFCLPLLKRIFSKFSGIRVFHNDSNTRHILEKLPETGARVLFGFCPELGLAEVKTKISKRMCLAGNLPPTGVLLKGRPEDVSRECQKLIEIGKPGGGYVLSFGGTAAPQTPLENIDAFIEAATAHGKYK